jgi:hypothetical protein
MRIREPGLIKAALIAVILAALTCKIASEPGQPPLDETDAHPHARLSRECPRGASAEAKRIIDVVIRTIAEDSNTVIAPSCPFNPDRDIFSRQNKHKLYEPGRFWRCEFCNKEFRSEAFLDRHMDSRHATEVQQGDTVCLADFCDTLGCPSALHADHHSHDHDHDHDHEADSPKGPATASHHHGNDAEQAFDRCVSLLQRCLSIDWASERGHEVLESVVHSFCDRDPCDHGRTAGFVMAPEGAAAGSGPFWGRGHVWVAVVASICLLSAGIACCIVYFDDPSSVPFALSEAERQHATSGWRRRDRPRHAFEEEDNGRRAARPDTHARRRLGVYGDGAAATGIGIDMSSG